MKTDEPIQKLLLLGGPLQRLGCRLGLVRDETNTVWLGLALGFLTWSVLVLLALLLGACHMVFSLSVIGVHIRLLVVIPLFFLCETWVVPRMAEFFNNIIRTGLVPATELPALASHIRRVNRLSNSWLAEVLCLLAALTIPLILDLPGRTADLKSLLVETGGRVGPVLFWYMGLCLPLFRFLLFRWVWKLVLWWYLLSRLRQLKLHLIPTHPDGAAGLGFLEIVQEQFAPLALAIAAFYSASFAENIASGAMAFEAVYSFIPLILLIVALLFVGPLFMFSRKLRLCRITGLIEYMGMASRYVRAFDRKWIQGENPAGELLLGTPDMQSLADLTNSVNVTRAMRIIPAGKRLMTVLAAAVIVPMLPLLLLKYPISHLSAQLLKMLTGL